MKKKLKILSLLLFFSYYGFSQDLFPIYADYFTDNLYLLHPASAGIGDCSKIRLTAKKQWLGYSDAPNLQTLSFHTAIDKNNGLGFIVFRDQNGYHSQAGGQITYAYHIDLSDFLETNLLSFGMSLSSVVYSLDDSEFKLEDPVFEQLENKYFYNVDAGLSYHYFDFFSFVSVKNIVKTDVLNKENENVPVDFMQYLVSLGYNIKFNYNFSMEPSTMFRYKNFTKERFMDFNLKANYSHEKSDFWAAVSYHKATNIQDFENSNYLSSYIGLNYNNFIFSYAFTFQNNDTYFPKGDYHQLTLGINFSCEK